MTSCINTVGILSPIYFGSEQLCFLKLLRYDSLLVWRADAPGLRDSRGRLRQHSQGLLQNRAHIGPVQIRVALVVERGQQAATLEHAVEVLHPPRVAFVIISRTW